MSDSQAMTPSAESDRRLAPKLVSVTDDVLFGDVWERTKLSKRDRSLISVVALITNGSTEQLRGPPRAGQGQRSERGRAQGGHHPPRVLRRLAPSDVCVTVEGDLRRLSAADPAHSRFRSSVPPGAGRRRTP